jgi:hypothetical protein
MDTSYLYSYNAERYQKLAERKLPCREKLNTTEVEQGYLLPNRFAKNRLFGCGGVLDAEKNYVKASEMNMQFRSQRKMKKKFIWETDTPLMIIKLNIWTKK